MIIRLLFAAIYDRTRFQQRLRILYGEPSRLMRSHISLFLIGMQIAMINGGSFPGRLFPNMAADRWGVMNAFIPICWICAGLVFVMLGLKSVGAIAVFAVIYGVFTGACKCKRI